MTTHTIFWWKRFYCFDSSIEFICKSIQIKFLITPSGWMPQYCMTLIRWKEVHATKWIMQLSIRAPYVRAIPQNIFTQLLTQHNFCDHTLINRFIEIGQDNMRIPDKNTNIKKVDNNLHCVRRIFRRKILLQNLEK